MPELYNARAKSRQRFLTLMAVLSMMFRRGTETERHAVNPNLWILQASHNLILILSPNNAII